MIFNVIFSHSFIRFNTYSWTTRSKEFYKPFQMMQFILIFINFILFFVLGIFHFEFQASYNRLNEYFKLIESHRISLMKTFDMLYRATWIQICHAFELTREKKRDIHVYILRSILLSSPLFRRRRKKTVQRIRFELVSCCL